MLDEPRGHAGSVYQRNKANVTGAGVPHIRTVYAVEHNARTRMQISPRCGDR